MTQDRIAEILGKIRDKSATLADRDELILGHEHLATYLAHKVGRNRFHMWPDLEGEAQLELTQVVNAIFLGNKVMRDNNIGGVITKNVSHRCKDYIEKYGFGVAMPGRTLRKRLRVGISKTLSPGLIQSKIESTKKDEIAKLPEVYQDGMIEKAKELTLAELKQLIKSEIYKLLPIPRVSVAVEDHPVQSNEHDYSGQGGNYTNKLFSVYRVPYGVPEAKKELSIEIKELLNKAAGTPIEQRILELRAQEYTYEEIAPKVGMSFNSVCNKVNAMEERFDYYASR
jgi:hypothetical protein